jgi:outer membrane protein assembly factor BamA
MIRQLTIYALLAAIVLIPSACSTTRRIADDEQLYTGVKSVDINTPTNHKLSSDLTSSVKTAVKVAPNNYWSLVGWRYPFPLGLWVYNNWPNPDSGFKHWIYEQLKEEPVLISDVRPAIRTKMIDDILANNGYFRSSTSYSLNSGRNPRKASITYVVNTGPAYRLDSIYLLADTCHLYHTIDSVASRSDYLQRGSIYCTDSLQAERTRIANVLRNRGYYYFRPEYIEYLADSVATPQHIALKLNIAANTPASALRRYRTGTVTTHIYRNSGGGTPDTIINSRGSTVVQMKPSRLRPQVIPECVTFRQGRTFSVRDMNRTQTYLSQLGIFSAISIDVLPDTVNPTSDLLNVEIACTIDRPLEANVEVNASSKSNSYLGPGLTLGLTNRNLFGGGELLSVSFTGSYEWQTGRDRKGSVFNSYEAGINASLSFPRLLAPKFIPRRRHAVNWTRIALNADLLNRPHYFKMAQFNASFNYDWQATRRASTTFTPFKLTYTKLLHTTEAFDSIMDSNQAIAQSFRNQFIPQMAYTYTYDRSYGSNNTINWQVNITEAGNIFWGLWRACGVKGEKKLFGMSFSQFIKAYTQLVYSHRTIGNQWLVTRAAIGAAHAYGNSSQVPYSEQFWVGGANSIRAFTVRSIGPGSYHAPASANGYFDQTGTFKVELNAEYRFPLVGPFHGAIFLDAGNVWLLKADESRPGGTLRASTFLRDLALGTGAGIRLDISMLVVRADLGIGLHAPWDTGRRGYYNMTSFGNSLAFHLAIGYPF